MKTVTTENAPPQSFRIIKGQNGISLKKALQYHNNILQRLDALSGLFAPRVKQLGIHGNSYTVANNDHNKYLRFTSAANITVYLPVLQITSPQILCVTLRQAGHGKVTVVGSGGAILNGKTRTAGQHAEMQATYIGGRVWDLRGGV